jgi:hypothetical protein
MTTISYGGGVQSTALVVLAAQGEIPCDAALFANVGDDSEHPDTLRYVREVAMPWAAARGVEIIELSRRLRDGTTRTLLEQVVRDAAKGQPSIPVRVSNGAPGNRQCTAVYKIRVIDRWLRPGRGKRVPVQKTR